MEGNPMSPRYRPLTEGYVVKGGQNHGPSQIADRPPPPAPMNARAADHRTVVDAVSRGIAAMPRRWRLACCAVIQQQLADDLRAQGLTELADKAMLVVRTLRKLENEN
jgi:hypothetical protein